MNLSKNRIEHLRKQVLDHPPYNDEYFCLNSEFLCLFYEKYTALSHLPEEERYGESFFYAFSNLTPSISEEELIVGERTWPVEREVTEKWKSTYLPIALERSTRAGSGQASHMAIDYELLLSRGIFGVLSSIDEYLSDCPPEKVPFYRSCKRSLEAVVAHAQNYAAHACHLAGQEADPIRKAELLEIARICEKVPAHPAESFYEAVQSVHFFTHCLSFNPFRPSAQQFQLGHPDRYLLPFYEKDLENGAITEEDAQILLDCLGIQINRRVPNGLSSGYMVGGRDTDGTLVANKLTELCMQVIDDIRLVYPSVGLCVTGETPDLYLKKACKLLSKGYSHPAIFNDDAITKGLLHYGVTPEESHSYIHSTCVEITPVAASNVWVASPYTNMPQILLDLMDREYEDFDALLAAYFRKLDSSIRNNFETYNQYRADRKANSLYPLLSCFVNDCLSRGVDIERGGARYNFTMPSFVGIANLTDSLYAIKKLVFEDQKLTLCQLKEAVDQDFKGQEALRQFIANKIPKYGNDCSEIDAFFGMITEHIASECAKYRGMYTNGNLIPSAFCWVMHERFGRETGATPDGRCAGFPLGDGSGPCQGRELHGPTASILSSTKWDHHKFIGGVAVNLKFSRALLGEQSLNAMEALIKTYLARGGFEVQINVVDNDILRKAKEHPEEYRDLVVRIGGYSDYFVKLSPEMQEELILRTVHQI